LSDVKIHPTAIVEKGAEIGKGVTVGPYSIIGSRVKLGDGVTVASHAIVENNTTVGAGTRICSFAHVGATPQDLKYKNEDTELIVGENNQIREYANLSLGTVGGGGKTIVGSRNLFMVGVHIAHDCYVGSDCVFANNVALAGHVHIGDRVIVGGMAGIHQFCRVGDYAMIAAGAIVVQDVAPYLMVQGDRAEVCGLNLVGLKRAKIVDDKMTIVKAMYHHLFQENRSFADAIAHIEAHVPRSEQRNVFVDFLKGSKRGICR